MLRLPRAAHYSICDSLCAHDTARLSETASQWNQKDDPRHAALHACVADRVARARGGGGLGRGNVVPGNTMASMLKFLEAVEWPKVHGNGKIMEQITYYAPARLPVSVEGHEDIDGQVVARASFGRDPLQTRRASGIAAVAGEHVTQIEPHQPYYSVRYGTVLHEEVLGGETFYLVFWPDYLSVQPCRIGHQFGHLGPGRRVVKKRPSWEPQPAFSPSTWKEMEELTKEQDLLEVERRLRQCYVACRDSVDPPRCELSDLGRVTFQALMRR